MATFRMAGTCVLGGEGHVVPRRTPAGDCGAAQPRRGMGLGQIFALTCRETMSPVGYTLIEDSKSLFANDSLCSAVFKCIFVSTLQRQ